MTEKTMKVSKKAVQALVVTMDSLGYEQDGDGLRFISPSKIKVHEFENWGEVARFANEALRDREAQRQADRECRTFMRKKFKGYVDEVNGRTTNRSSR